MFVDVAVQARFAPDRPVRQVIDRGEDYRVVVFGLEPGQAVQPHTGPGPVTLYVVQGTGWLRVGDEEREVWPGCLAVCPPGNVHAFRAGQDGRLVILATIMPRRPQQA